MPKSVDLSARIKKLEASRLRAGKLEGDGKLSAKPMSEMLGVSWVTLRGWCNDDPEFEASGAFIRGSEGVQWEFHAVNTIDYLLGHFRAQHEKRKSSTRKVKQIISGGDDDISGLPDDITIDEMGKVVKLSTDLQRHKIQQGELADAEMMADCAMQYHIRLKNALVGAAQKQDPNGQWPPEIRESFDEAFRNILVEAEDAASEWLNGIGAGTTQPQVATA